MAQATDLSAESQTLTTTFQLTATPAGFVENPFPIYDALPRHGEKCFWSKAQAPKACRNPL